MSCLMALDGAEAVGFATWTLTFPAGPGVALYMKELFVSASARRKGVARKLMAGLIDIAKTKNCTRLDWQTDETNQNSQAFYKGISAPNFSKQTYRITAGDFEDFLRNLG